MCLFAARTRFVAGCLEPNTVTWRSAYHGLVRAVVRVTLDAATPSRVRRAAIDVEAGVGGRSSSVLAPGTPAPTSMTVTATAPGLPSAALIIPLSTDTADTPLAAAAASVASAWLE